VPRSLVEGSVVFWAQYIGLVSDELEGRITSGGAQPSGSMEWFSLPETPESITYEFRMAFTGSLRQSLRIMRSSASAHPPRQFAEQCGARLELMDDDE
jgi:hypothetical protein